MQLISKIQNSTITITGGAGFVGSHLVEEICRYQPKKVFILDNLVRGRLRNLDNVINNPNVDFIEGDICDEKMIGKVLHESEFCFHLAALRINACAADPVSAFDSMAKGTFMLIDLAKKYGVKKFIYSSSASVYGLAESFPTPESNHPYDNQTFYGATKLFGEQVLRSYHHMFGFNYVGLRYYNIYGPRMDTDGRYTEVLIKWLKCINNQEQPIIFGSGDDTMDFVYVTDVVKANILALNTEVTGEVFNVGFGQEVSLKELLSKLLMVSNSQLQPAFMHTNTINPVSRRLADTNRAENLLGFKAEVGLEDGLSKLTDWFFSRGDT